MPTYVLINKWPNWEYADTSFEADDDEAARAMLPNQIPMQARNRQGYSAHVARSYLGRQRFHPRMARPQVGFPTLMETLPTGPLSIHEENAQSALPHDEIALASSVNQLTVLVRNLQEVFRTVEPHAENMKVYGHLVRNTLILAAMDFESECRGVLLANGYSPSGSSDRWTTNDYVKLLSPLRLNEFTVGLSHYPAIQPRCPFAGWDKSGPTKTLSWYDAYNAVKHDREGAMKRATLEMAVDAVVACAIMLAAEYRIIRSWQYQLGDFFIFERSPQWLPGNRYVFARDAGDWVPVNYQFEN